MNIDGLKQLDLNTLKKPGEKPVSETKRNTDSKQIPASDKYEKGPSPDNGTDVAQIIRFAKEAPEVRIDKIEEVRAKISQGVYNFQKTQEDIAARLATYL
jgi:hypothetical protein